MCLKRREISSFSLTICTAYALDHAWLRSRYLGRRGHRLRDDTVTGEFTRVKTIKAMRQYLSEYEVSDVECLSEWVHNAMVKVVKLYIEEYKIDMEIDFRINRDKENLPGSKAGRDRPDDGMISLVKSFLQRQA